MILSQEDLVHDGMISVDDKAKMMEEYALERRSMEERFSDRRSLQTNVMRGRMRKRKEMGIRKLKDRQQQDKAEVCPFCRC